MTLQSLWVLGAWVSMTESLVFSEKGCLGLTSVFALYLEVAG